MRVSPTSLWRAGERLGLLLLGLLLLLLLAAVASACGWAAGVSPSLIATNFFMPCDQTLSRIVSPGFFEAM